MDIHIVADNPGKLANLRSMLEPQYRLTTALLGGGLISRRGSDAAIIAVDLRIADHVSALKEVFPRLKGVRRRIFVIEQKARLSAVQAYALGATNVLVSPVSQQSLRVALAEFRPSTEPSKDAADDARATASAGASALNSMFAAVMGGGSIDIAEVKAAAHRMADNIAEHGLSNWLDTVRRHHEGTYQHCLLVTGVAIDFGLSLGLARADIERLYSAAMFHDIGKATIPLTVLDKPGRLDAHERALIETHPATGYDILKAAPGISSEILDAVRHHHEYLDGSGYPDGLDAADIPDIVRILTISDIFAALIEHRRYKPSMPRQQAYDIIGSMRGKLEGPLITAFKDVALNR